MLGDELEAAATAEGVARHFAKNEGRLKLPEGHHSAGMESLRQFSHRGHQIVIRTTYTIAVDGNPLRGHIEVANSGQVHYHGMPNYSFASAVDLVKQLIDLFPDDFQTTAPKRRGSEADHH